MKKIYKKIFIIQGVILLSMLLINCGVEPKISKSFQSGNELVKYLNNNQDKINKNVLYYDSNLPVSTKFINLHYSLIKNADYKRSYISLQEIDYLNKENTIEWYSLDYRFVSYFFEKEINELNYIIDENFNDSKTIFNKLISVYNDTLLVGEIFIFDPHNIESDQLIDFFKSKIILITNETKFNEEKITKPKKCNTYSELGEYLQFYTNEIRDTYGNHISLNLEEQSVYNFRYDFTDQYQNLKFNSHGKILFEEQMIDCGFESFYTKEKIIKDEIEFRVLKIHYDLRSYIQIELYMQNELLGVIKIVNNEVSDGLLNKIKENIIIIE